MFDDDLMLPKATIVKAIKERIPVDMRVGGETADLVVACCTTLIHVLSSTANDISEKGKRATIQPEDVVEAARELGFASYVPVLEKALEEWKSEKKEAKNLKSKKAASMNGMSQEELIKMQQQLFQQAKDKAQGAME